MTELETLRVLSLIGLGAWIVAAGFSLPALFKTHPLKHPLAILLISFAVLEACRSLAHVDAAFAATHMLEDTRGNLSIWGLRVASTIEAILFFIVLLKVRHEHH